MIPVPETLTEGTDNHRLFMALRSGQPKSHHELYGLHMIVHSRASDLRLKHNCLIDTWRDGKTTWYQLRSVGDVRDGAVAPGGEPGPPHHGQSSSIRDCPPEASLHGEVSEPGSSLTTPSSLPGTSPAQLTVWEAA